MSRYRKQPTTLTTEQMFACREWTRDFNVFDNLSKEKAEKWGPVLIAQLVLRGGLRPGASPVRALNKLFGPFDGFKTHWLPRWRSKVASQAERERTACGVDFQSEGTSVKANVTCKNCLRLIKKAGKKS